MTWLQDNKFTITWTSVPSGFTTRNGQRELRLKVLVSPRFSKESDAETVAERVFQDWPTLVRTELNNFKVTFSTNDNRHSLTVDGEVLTHSLATSNQWRTAFPSQNVRELNAKKPSKLNVTEGLASSYDAIAVDSQVKSRRIVTAFHEFAMLQVQESTLAGFEQADLYVKAAELTDIYESSWASLSWTNSTSQYGQWAVSSFQDDPTIRNVVEDDRTRKLEARNRFRLVPNGNIQPAVNNRLNFIRDIPTNGIVPNNIASSATVEAVAFNSRVKPLPGKEPSFPPEPYDFSERLGLVRNYPFFSERLGLILDVRVPLSQLERARELLVAGAKTKSELRVWAVPVWAQSDVEALCPSTRCDLNANTKQFHASELTPDGLAEDPDHAEGHLRLDTGKWILTSTDLDGASIKAFNFAESRGEVQPKIMTDFDGLIQHANPSAIALLTRGAADEILKGTPISTFIKREETNSILERLLEVGLPKRKIVRTFNFNVVGVNGYPDQVDFGVRLECFESANQAVCCWTMEPIDNVPVASESITPPSYRSTGR